MLPRLIDPQLLTPSRQAPEGDGWIHEVKYDGFRLLCRLEGGRARLVTRNGNDWTSRLPAVARAAEALELRDAWLDGELVVLGPDGVPSFAALQKAMRQRGEGLTYQVFDAPWLDGRAIAHECVLERKARLEERVRGRCARGMVRYSDHLRGEGAAFFARAFEAGLEGIVSKRVGSGYRAGVRCREWLKVKCFHTFRFRVAGHTPGLEALVLCDVGGNGGRAYVGRVAGWARPDVRRALREALAPLRRRDPSVAGAEKEGAMRWVEPAVEVEVAALAWKPGDRLRHATLRRVVGTPAAAG
jgi:bifunctional non-homologous end joining protein LigD